MTLSIVIVNFNVCDLLLACVRSLEKAMEGIESEIIVVDNASTDGVVQAFAHQFPTIEVIRLEQNCGFGAANNVGIARASGEFILLLNPDTIVQENTLFVMLEFMRGHQEAAFAGCRIILPNGTLDPVSKRGFPSPWSSFCRVFGLSRIFPNSRLFGGYNLTFIPDDVVSSVEALAGCFMFCRAAVLRQLGGFDTEFFLYGEDLDLCLRARKEGWRIYYVPQTSILHLKGESTRRSSIDSLALFYEAMEIFARKHFRSNLLLLGLVRIGIAFRRFFARIGEQSPGWSFFWVDVIASIFGFMLGSMWKFGTPFDYPSDAVIAVWGVPPLLFVLGIYLAGGYGLDDRTPSKSLLGVLGGFFVLSALPFFFKDYAFSRGVVLVTTSVVGVVGVSFRFVRLLLRRTFGQDAIKRVAVLGREALDGSARAAVKSLAVASQVTVVGTIAPTVEELDSSRVGELGSVDNISRIVRAHRISDIVVIDTKMAYSEVLRATQLVRDRRVRFHIVHGRGEFERLDADATPTSALPYGGPPTRGQSRIRSRLVALLVVIVFVPAVYWLAPSYRAVIRVMWDVVMGRRPLVGSGCSPPHPIFSLTSLIGGENLTHAELIVIEQSYLARRSLLLDAEIIIGVLRTGQLCAVNEPGTRKEVHNRRRAAEWFR